jgi:hypothetical protein
MNNELKYQFRRIKLYYHSFRYSRYYHNVVSLAIATIGLLIFILFVLPQINEWFSIRGEVTTQKEKIRVLEQNYTTLENLDKMNLDNEYMLTSQALPQYKDFVLIINAVNKAAAISGVMLEDYNFIVDEQKVSGVEKKTDLQNAVQQIKFQINFSSTVKNVNVFMEEINATLPLAEVEEIQFAKGKGTLEVVFNNIPLLKSSANYSDDIALITNKDREIIAKLRNWLMR